MFVYTISDVMGVILMIPVVLYGLIMAVLWLILKVRSMRKKVE